MTVANKEISEKSFAAMARISPNWPRESLEYNQRWALEATGMFFNPKEHFGQLWAGGTYGQVGSKIQEVVGPLVERPELRPRVEEFLTRVLEKDGDTVLQAWQVPTIPNALLAEIKYANQEVHLVWFDTDYIKENFASKGK